MPIDFIRYTKILLLWIIMMWILTLFSTKGPSISQTCRLPIRTINNPILELLPSYWDIKFKTFCYKTNILET